MGSTFSSANSVYVQLDKPWYYAGDLMNGVVCLNVTEPFESTKLHLKFTGKEETEWSQQETEWVQEKDGPHSRSVTRYYSGSDTIIKVDIPLPLPSSTLKPAQYQFPFATILPAGLPGSFEGRLSQGRGKIKYEVEAHCEVPGMFKRDLRFERKLYIRQRFDLPINKKYQMESSSIETCCCCNQGSASAEVMASKDAVIAGEVVELTATVNNNSAVDFSEVRATLWWRLELKGSGRYFDQSSKLGRWKVQGVPAQETGVERQITCQLPPELNISTQSGLIKSEYALEFELVAGAMTSNLSTMIKISVYEPQPAQEVFFEQAPAYWHPEVVMPVHQFQLPSAPPMPPMQQPPMTASQGMPAPNYGYGAPPGYGGPPGTYPPPGGPQGYASGSAAPQGYGNGGGPSQGYSNGAPPPEGYGSGAPPPQGYSSGAPPPQGYGSGAPPPQGYGSGAPPPQGYGSGAAPPQGYSSGAPPPQQYGSGGPPPQGYGSGAPPPQGYGSGAAPGYPAQGGYPPPQPLYAGSQPPQQGYPPQPGYQT